MDNHHVGRGRGSVEDVLRGIKARTLVIGVDSDILFPVQEQQLLAQLIPGAELQLLASPYGHDGFLVEFEQFKKLIRTFLKTNVNILL
jgi:homoserine O-acetyltransferase